MAKDLGNSKGFTLVETAVVLVIGGLILTMLFSSLNIYLKNSKLNTTRERIAAIDTQIQVYLNSQGHLPCPASLGIITITDDNYGTETDCTLDRIEDETFGTNNVRIGMAPTRTLNLPDEFGYDAWGNRIVYAVTRSLARNADNYSSTGGLISVVDSKNNSVTDDEDSTHYVIFSPGINQRGAFNSNGIQMRRCPANNATLDEENCDNNGRFRYTVLVGDAVGTNEYDDVFVSRSTMDFDREIPPGAVMLFNLPACPEGWVNSNIAGTIPTGHRYCRKPGV